MNDSAASYPLLDIHDLSVSFGHGETEARAAVSYTHLTLPTILLV